MLGVLFFLCAREDLNLHTRRHTHLKGACIPISPLAQHTPFDYTYFYKRENPIPESGIGFSGELINVVYVI